MFPDTIPSSIYTLRYWVKVGVKLYDLATMGHKQAMHMLLVWEVIFETLKKKEPTQVVSSEDVAGPLPRSDSPCLLETGAPDTGERPQPSTLLCPDKGGEGFLSHCC
ncbi:hypothetical protein Nmel_015693 [Mimus melanotis]